MAPTRRPRLFITGGSENPRSSVHPYARLQSELTRHIMIELNQTAMAARVELGRLRLNHPENSELVVQQVQVVRAAEDACVNLTTAGNVIVGAIENSNHLPAMAVYQHVGEPVLHIAMDIEVPENDSILAILANDDETEDEEETDTEDETPCRNNNFSDDSEDDDPSAASSACGSGGDDGDDHYPEYFEWDESILSEDIELTDAEDALRRRVVSLLADLARTWLPRLGLDDDGDESDVHVAAFFYTMLSAVIQSELIIIIRHTIHPTVFSVGDNKRCLNECNTFLRTSVLQLPSACVAPPQEEITDTEDDVFEPRRTRSVRLDSARNGDYEPLAFPENSTLEHVVVDQYSPAPPPPFSGDEDTPYTPAASPALSTSTIGYAENYPERVYGVIDLTQDDTPEPVEVIDLTQDDFTQADGEIPSTSSGITHSSDYSPQSPPPADRGNNDEAEYFPVGSVVSEMMRILTETETDEDIPLDILRAQVAEIVNDVSPSDLTVQVVLAILMQNIANTITAELTHSQNVSRINVRLFNIIAAACLKYPDLAPTTIDTVSNMLIDAAKNTKEE